MGSQILFNVRPYQTRVAFVKEGLLTDLFYQRNEKPSLVGTIFKGKVSKLAEKLNFAFVELGLKKAGFLYGKDLSESKKLIKNLKKDEFILVQAKSDPLRKKGLRLTMDVSLAGRYLVYMPQSLAKTSLSRRIQGDKERKRLLEIFKNFQEPCSIIGRTLAQKRSEEELKKDLEALKLQWEKIQADYSEKEEVGAIQKGLDSGLSYLKDLMNDSIEAVWVDDKEAYENIQKFVKEWLPEFHSRVKYFSKKKSLFKQFRLEEQIEKLHLQKVSLKNGGFLIIEELEAFTVIDVNSGRFMGKKNLKETLLTLNLEAAKAIAEQIRLRHLGGIILIDFIDMEDEDSNQKLVSSLANQVKEDKSHPKVFPMSNLGLVQITRKRTRQSLSHFTTEKCSACNGLGQVKTSITVAGDIFLALENKAPQPAWFFKKKSHPKVFLNPTIKKWIDKEETKALEFLQKELAIVPEWHEDGQLPLEKFKIQL